MATGQNIRVSTYFDSKGLMSAVKEAKRPVLRKAALKIRNRARKSLKKGPTGKVNFADLLKQEKPALASLINLFTVGAGADGDIRLSRFFALAKLNGVPPVVVKWILSRRKDFRSKRGRTRRRGFPSKPGTPPHSQTGTLKKSIIAEEDRNTGNVQVGPSGPGWYGRLHEFGLGKHPERPFMVPALEKERRRLPEGFKDMKIARTKAGRKMNRRTGKGRPVK